MTDKDKTHFIEFTDTNGQHIKVKIDQYQASRLLEQLQQSVIIPIDKENRWDKVSFSKNILSISRQVPISARLSETEVMINRIWLYWQQINTPMTLHIFKQRLLACIQDELIHAGCVVLLQTHNMTDLIDSEIIDNNGNIYHFIKE